MKNYKSLIPILLIVLFAVSVYSLVDAKSKANKELENSIANARELAKQGIYNDANNAYLKAYNANESFILAEEIGEYYVNSKQDNEIESWGEKLISKYPKETYGYEYLLKYYIRKEKYRDCFVLAEKFNRRGLHSADFNSLLSSIEYEYFISAGYDDVGEYIGGMCPMLIKEKWGYANKNGKKAIDAKYIKAGAFSDGLAPVVDADGDAYFIDDAGNKKQVVLIEGQKVVELGAIRNGLIPVFNGRKWAFYNSDYKHVFGDYDMAYPFANGMAAVAEGRVWSLINTDGEAVISGVSGIAVDANGVAFRNGRFFALKDYLYSMYDGEGNLVSDSYEDVKVFKDNSYAAVRVNSKWGFIDNSGNMVIEPQYEDARSFSNGYAAVKMYGKWGFIDKDNNYIINVEFEDAKDFTDNGRVFVKERDSWQQLCLYKYNY